MEIERKWMVNGWPEGLAMEEEFAMRQGYISVRPTVRIREEALAGGRTDYVLRALRVPAGEHEIVFSFDPQSLKVTNTVAIASVAVIYLICLVALVVWLIHIASSRRKEGGKK
mgnify:CR=1 FL=1